MKDYVKVHTSDGIIITKQIYFFRGGDVAGRNRLYVRIGRLS